MIQFFNKQLHHKTFATSYHNFVTKLSQQLRHKIFRNKLSQHHITSYHKIFHNKCVIDYFKTFQQTIKQIFITTTSSQNFRNILSQLRHKTFATSLHISSQNFRNISSQLRHKTFATSLHKIFRNKLSQHLITSLHKTFATSLHNFVTKLSQHPHKTFATSHHISSQNFITTSLHKTFHNIHFIKHFIKHPQTFDELFLRNDMVNYIMHHNTLW